MGQSFTQTLLPIGGLSGQAQEKGLLFPLFFARYDQRYYTTNNPTKMTHSKLFSGKHPFRDRSGITNQYSFSLKQIQSDIQQNTIW